MKKNIIIIISFMLLAFVFINKANAQSASSQPSQKKPEQKRDTVKKIAIPVPYKANPARQYLITLTENEIMSVLQSGNAGVIPLLKTTKIPMDQLDNETAYFGAIFNKIQQQYSSQWAADRAKFVADSLKAVSTVKK